MSMPARITLVIALILSIIIPFSYYLITSRNNAKDRRKRYRLTIAANAFSFFGIMLVAIIMMFAGGTPVAAAEESVASTAGFATGMGYLAAALVTGMSCIGGGIAVSSAASAALGAISENDSILGKSLIFVGLAEGVALYGLIISFMILGRL